MVTPAAKREAAAHLCSVHGVSQRRACEALEVDRSSVRYRSTRPDDRELREAMKAAVDGHLLYPTFLSRPADAI